jgi:hypothetical protein
MPARQGRSRRRQLFKPCMCPRFGRWQICHPRQVRQAPFKRGAVAFGSQRPPTCPQPLRRRAPTYDCPKLHCDAPVRCVTTPGERGATPWSKWSDPPGALFCPIRVQGATEPEIPQKPLLVARNRVTTVQGGGLGIGCLWWKVIAGSAAQPRQPRIKTNVLSFRLCDSHSPDDNRHPPHLGPSIMANAEGRADTIKEGRSR